MVDVIGDPDLYRFIPFDPPILEKLQQRYKRWEARISPEQDEIWLNWVARLKPDGPYIGDFQVGYKENREANIAYRLAKLYQSQGFATEALRKIIDILFNNLDILSVKAWVDTRNKRSIALVKKLGLMQVDFITRADHFKGEDSDEFVFEMRSEDYGRKEIPLPHG
ncbi:MAG: GCN5-related N-acetyltransferase [Alphaproteobacteria bacterium]|nr:GCN5-related N-acetyltransferase [Alphaproteobacteria bacterium]